MRKSAIGRVLFVVLIVLAVALGSASSALAAVHHPKGEFAAFAECPTEKARVESCVYAKVESGELIVGKQGLPIINSITLQGGLIENLETGALTFVGAAGGNTLAKSPQNVPGGLSDFVNCTQMGNIIERFECELVFKGETTGVIATTELAAPASAIELKEGSLFEGTGTALLLPIKVHLENPFLGSECYIATNSHPLAIPFTTGTTSPPAPNIPITGNSGELVTSEEGSILTFNKNSLVNNSFVAPEVTGCGGVFAPSMDPIIDAKLGLPAAAGHNTAILDDTLRLGNAELIKASEG